MFSKDCSPGPAHAIDPKITRKGADGTPQYSLGDTTPSANTYSLPPLTGPQMKSSQHKS